MADSAYTLLAKAAGTGVQKRSAGQGLSIGKKVEYYVLPAGSSPTLIKYWIMHIIFCGTSHEDSLHPWKIWVASYCCAISAGFSNAIKGGPYTTITLTPAETNAISVAYGALDSAINRGTEEDASAQVGAIKALTIASLLPKIAPEADLALSNDEWDEKGMLCHYSLMLFLAGKLIRDDKKEQITVLRPKALRGKAHLENVQELLEGSLKMSNESHLQIHYAWAEMSLLRSVAFKEYMTYDREGPTVEEEIIWTTMHLLKFSGMSHVIIASQFIATYPWIVEVPGLKKAVAIFEAGVRVAAKMPPGELEFTKLINGDRINIFPNKDMQSIIACAVSEGKDVGDSVQDYYCSGEFEPVVQAFREEKERRENTRLLKQKKEEEELEAVVVAPEEEE